MELAGVFSVLREPDGGTSPARRTRVTAYAHNPREDTVACGDDEGCVALWDLRTAREQRLLYAPDLAIGAYRDSVLSVVFSPDGTLLVSTNHGRPPDCAACVWDVRTGELIHRFGGFRYCIYASAFGPDGDVLALAGDDRVVKLFDVATGDERTPSFARLPYSISALAFSPDGRYLVAGCDGELLVIYDLMAGTERRLVGHVEWTWAVAFSPQGHVFASGGENEVVWLWEVASGRRARELDGHPVPSEHWGGTVFAVAFSPDGMQLASAGSDMAARLWDPATGRSMGTLPHSARDTDDSVRWVTYLRHGDEVLTGTTGGQVSRWRSASRRSLEPGPLERAQ